MGRNMSNNLTEAIDDYVRIHKVDHASVGVICIPFVITKVITSDDGATSAKAHTLIVSTTNKYNVINIINASAKKLEAGEYEFHGPGFGY